MTCDHPFDAQRPARVMAEVPRHGAGVSKALRETFRVGEGMPGDLARLLDRLRNIG